MAEGSIEWKHTAEDGFVIRVKPGFNAPDAGDVRRHVIAARREVLLAIRSLVDIAINCTDEKNRNAGQPPTRIDVE